LSKPAWIPYIDRGKPGALRYDHDGKLPLVREPPVAPEKTIKSLPKTGAGVDVNAALERWARWVHDSLAGVGWPDKTLLARVIEYGALGAAQGHYGSLIIVGTVVEYDEVCAWVEVALMRLPNEEREVVTHAYLRRGSAEVHAKELGITRGTFDSRLSRARRSVKDYLDGRKAAALALQENVP
jgi:predicted DNA-binding protein (UPF0251 family)